MKPTALMILGLTAVMSSSIVLAHEPESHSGHDWNERIWLAQMSHEERERLRERWERTSPDQRNQIRRELHERLDAIPPEQREQIRKRLIERVEEKEHAEREYRHEQLREVNGNGFGRGFEHRQEPEKPRHATDRPSSSDRR